MSLPRIISEHIGRMPSGVPLQGRERAVLFEAQPFLGLLGPDRARFEALATVSVDIPNDSRSAVIPLSCPIELSGMTIRGLRLKGIYPVHDGTGAVLPYTAGGGFVPMLIEPAGENIVASRTQRQEWEYSPLGSISALRLQEEVRTALGLGAGLTDVLLGAGLHPELSFCKAPVGFAVYGMSSLLDNRAKAYFDSGIDADDTVSEVSRKALEIGALLRRMHNEGFIHGYPHLDNIRMAEEGVRLLDLDTAKPLAAFDGRMTAALYLDVARTANDLIRNESVWCLVEGDRISVDRPLFLSFLQGYFLEDESIPLLKQIRDHLNGSSGSALDYGFLTPYGFRDGKGYRNYDQFSILEPVISLYCSPPGSSVDLAQMFVENAPNEFYRNFYLALGQVAASLGG